MATTRSGAASRVEAFKYLILEQYLLDPFESFLNGTSQKDVLAFILYQCCNESILRVWK